MKKQTTLCLVASLIGAAAVFAQTTATTTPVGYITCNIAGKSPSADTYISPSLAQATEYASVTVSAAANVLTFSGGVPDTFGPAYLLEITSGASEGWWSTVTSSTATTITLNDSFPSGLSEGVTVSVRKHNTLASFLGENAPGLTTYNGVDPNDEVHIWNPSTQSLVIYTYIGGADLGDPLYPNGAWYDPSAAGDPIANGAVIEPGTAVRVVRVSATALSFVTTGTVKTTKTQVDIYKDFNWLGTMLATGSAFNGMGLNNSLVLYDGVNPYDELQIVNADQTVSQYAAYDTGAGNDFLQIGTEEYAAGDTPFAEGTGAVLARGTAAASTITIPGTVVAP